RSDAGSLKDAGSAGDAGQRTDAGISNTGGLPEGDHGLAASHPGDQGIAADPAVIFADDFESYSQASELSRNWDAVYHNVRIATEAANIYAGSKALEFTV